MMNQSNREVKPPALLKPPEQRYPLYIECCWSLSPVLSSWNFYLRCGPPPKRRVRN